MRPQPTFRAGDWVEVRSKEEILRTLDKQSERDGLPFMPEMFQFCGKRFPVFKSAHKTCDPPSGLGARRMRDGVHLTGVRCDGQTHGGCQAGCLIFWKDAWLKPVGRGAVASPSLVPVGDSPATSAPACTEDDVVAGARGPGESAGPGGPVYRCQSTRLRAATAPLPWWDLRQYAEDLRSRNARPSQLAAAFLFFLYHSLVESGVGLGGALRWAYDGFQKVRGGSPYPLRQGQVEKGAATPVSTLDLEPGELVRVRSYREILDTLDEGWRNRGMYFDPELVPYCGGTYRVLRRVGQIIDERTGRMLRLKSDAVILNGVVCQARYSKCRHFCSRSIYPYWREIWLERAPSQPQPGAGAPRKGCEMDKGEITDRISAVANQLLRDRHDKAVLEAGCGSASYFHFEDVGRFVGIDIDADQLAKNTALRERVLGDLETYPLPTAEFDIVVCWDVIEHLARPRDALRNMFGAVKPGGLLILGFPNLLSFKGLVTKATPFRFHEAFYRYMKYTARHFPTYLRLVILPDRVTALAAEHDFSVVHRTLYEGAVTQRFLKRFGAVKGIFTATDAVWRLVTAGRYNSLFLDNCALVLQKGGDRTDRVDGMARAAGRIELRSPAAVD